MTYKIHAFLLLLLTNGIHSYEKCETSEENGLCVNSEQCEEPRVRKKRFEITVPDWEKSLEESLGNFILKEGGEDNPDVTMYKVFVMRTWETTTKADASCPSGEICCPLSRTKTKANEKCKEYAKKAKLGIRTAIVGGFFAGRSEFPHMAALGFGRRFNIQWKCGGSLISDRFVLTAAHCLQSRGFGKVKFVRIGEESVGRFYNPFSDYGVARRIGHPEYNPPLVYNDIGLIELEQVIKFSRNVQPACLYVKDSVPERMIATGWGSTHYLSINSNTLKKVTLDLFDNKECRSLWRPSVRKMPRGFLEDLQLCVGRRNGSEDTCEGDSGGPLQIKGQSDQYHVIGITSIGKHCGLDNFPAIYTKITTYIPWIETIVWT